MNLLRECLKNTESLLWYLSKFKHEETSNMLDTHTHTQIYVYLYVHTYVHTCIQLQICNCTQCTM